MSLYSKILIIGGLVAVMAVGVTVAYFSDGEKSENNVFTAGTLDLSINESAETSWQAGNWLPGDEAEGELELKNDGTLPIETLLMTIE
jgi:predicted ribosomally synthesized peptide with SipW-like signal peptide